MSDSKDICYDEYFDLDGDGRIDMSEACLEYMTYRSLAEEDEKESDGVGWSDPDLYFDSEPFEEDEDADDEEDEEIDPEPEEVFPEPGGGEPLTTRGQIDALSPEERLFLAEKVFEVTKKSCENKTALCVFAAAVVCCAMGVFMICSWTHGVTAATLGTAAALGLGGVAVRRARTAIGRKRAELLTAGTAYREAKKEARSGCS